MQNTTKHAIFLRGSHGFGKSTFMVHIYESLFLNHQSQQTVLFYALDSRDCRQQSMSALLTTVIQQLLSREPELIPIDEQACADDGEDIQWSEGSLWVRLSSLLRRAQYSPIILVLDCSRDCNPGEWSRSLQSFVELTQMAAGRFKTVCAVDSRTVDDKFSKSISICLDLDHSPDIKDTWVHFKADLVAQLKSENPNLSISGVSVNRCFDGSEGFLHSALIAHRIRSITALSSPECIGTELAKISGSLEKTVLAITSQVPSWWAKAVAWLLFVRRPLKETELSVAVALEDWASTSNGYRELDEKFIARNLGSDLRSQLGPLISLRSGGIHISHRSVDKVLFGWMQSNNVQFGANHFHMTQQLMSYVQACLNFLKPKSHMIIPPKLSFNLLEYALEIWNTHYRDATKSSDSLVSQTARDSLSTLAFDLLTIKKYQRWLRPVSPFGRSLWIQKRDSMPQTYPLRLTVEYGLPDVFSKLVDQMGQPEREGLLRIACAFKRGDIVNHLVSVIQNHESISHELAKACRRADIATATVLLERYHSTSKTPGLPSDLLPTVCRIGDKALAQLLIANGAKLNEGATILPLHAAINEGHLEIVELLLEKHADPNPVFPDNSTPLQKSIKIGYKHIASCILKLGDLHDTPNDQGETAVSLAAAAGDYELLEKILVFPWLKPEVVLRKRRITHGSPPMVIFAL